MPSLAEKNHFLRAGQTIARPKKKVFNQAQPPPHRLKTGGYQSETKEEISNGQSKMNTRQSSILITFTAMRNVLLISSLLMLIASGVHAQSSYDREMETLARLINTAVNVSGKQRVAVLDFTDIDGRGNTLGAHVAEDLRYWLLQTNRQYTVLERSALDRVINEQKLSAEAIIDETSAVEFGKLLATDAIIFGSVLVDGRKATVTAKVIDVETGALLSMERVQVKVSRAVSREYDQADDWMKRKPESAAAPRETPPYAPVLFAPTAGARSFYSRALLTVGLNTNLQMQGQSKVIDGKRREVPSNRSFVLGVEYQVNPTEFNAPFVMGYRQVLGNNSDALPMALNENGDVLTAGDVWLLGEVPEYEDYLLDERIESARISHVRLENIRTQHFNFDFWYKVYLTPEYYYRDAFRFYAGAGVGFDVIIINADYVGEEAFYQETPDPLNPNYTLDVTTFREAEFPFDGFNKNLAFLNWNLYVGFEKGRFGVQTTWGLSTMMSDAPLILPYLNRNHAESRAVSRSIEESGFYLFDQVLPESSGSGSTSNTVSITPSADASPFLELLNAGLKLTYTF